MAGLNQAHEAKLILAALVVALNVKLLAIRGSPPNNLLEMPHLSLETT
jgi:hypothetical protein